MKREIFNPFEKAPSKSEASNSFESNSTFKVEDPNSCPKCGCSLLEASIGGHGDVEKSNVKYCTKCRVVIPIENQY